MPKSKITIKTSYDGNESYVKRRLESILNDAVTDEDDDDYAEVSDKYDEYDEYDDEPDYEETVLQRKSFKERVDGLLNKQFLIKTIDNINFNKKFTGTEHNRSFFIRFAIGIVFEIFIWIVLLLLLIAFIIVAASKTPKKTFLGYSCYSVADECLEPLYNMGDCVITGVTDAGEIGVGDFITFTDDGDYAAGIVDSTLDNYKNVNAKFFRVKDPYNNTYIVEPKNIIGREVYKISKFGYIVSLLGSKMLYE